MKYSVKIFNHFFKHGTATRNKSTSIRILSNEFHHQKKPIMTTSLDDIEKCKAVAAQAAVDENINTNCIVGIGSGTTMTYVLERLKRKCDEEKLAIKCIPTSFQAKQLIHDSGLPITELDLHPVIDVTIDGADEVDRNFVAIKGGGACLAQEKVVAHAADKFVVVADYRKNSTHLGQSWTKGIPIEVLPMACNAVVYRICTMFGVDPHDLKLRIGREKAGPVITDNGNMILDWKFSLESMQNYTSTDWKALSDKVKLIPGVVETGIFSGMVHMAYFGQKDGSVVKRVPN